MNGVSARPGRTAAKYSRTGMLIRRQVSTTERMAATLGPACWLPIWIQFLRPSATKPAANNAAAGIDAIATKTFDWSECTHCVVAVDIVDRQGSTTGL